jgi:hypothetical protein
MFQEAAKERSSLITGRDGVQQATEEGGPRRQEVEAAPEEAEAARMVVNALAKIPQV